ncbi:galectin-12-like, partial [Heterodontus francisci]|uniref:galectin-12-like n=1 Tax=Heterodontus francisci TaxID=7792 RepID=UPI00355C56BE
VVANGNQLLEFRYRFPLGLVDTLQVAGPVFIKVIGFLTENLFSRKDPNLAVPLLRRIESGLAAGHMITMRGQLHQEPRVFQVLLREEYSGNVPLRLSVDFEKKVLLRSSLLDQVWAREEDETPIFSFHPARYFEILVLCQVDGFRVAVNGTHCADYSPGALCLERVQELAVSGDVELFWLETQRLI